MGFYHWSKIDVIFELHFRQKSAVMIQRLSCCMYASYGLDELYVKALDLIGFTMAIVRQIIKRSMNYQLKKYGHIWQKTYNFVWFLAMDPVTIFDSKCRKLSYLTNK